METNRVIVGDCREQLSQLPESSVHMCMTSPPYWQLRDYGGGTVTVWGGDDDCNHEWIVAGEVKRGGQNTDENPPDVGGNQHAQDTGIRGNGVESHECQRCGAWRGQLGLEPTVEQYIQNIATVCDRIQRVLRPDGSLWLNLGDTYKDKCKQLIPHRVAVELQSRGWVVRNDVTWVKPNPMPSSVKDRLNTSTEQIFHLTPEPDYWYDLDAIREEYSQSTTEEAAPYPVREGVKNAPSDNHSVNQPAKKLGDFLHPSGKNPGDVFEVTTKPFPDAHFAVYPPELCEKPIKATCPPKVCVECGTPYERHRETEPRPDRRDRDKPRRQYDGNTEDHNNRISWVGTPKDVVDEWWEQTCECATDETQPGIAIDPFAGAGTTLLKAKDLCRRFIGIELNPEYADMARKRVSLDIDDPGRFREDRQGGLESFTD